MKFSLLTLGVLALGAQQASAAERNDSTTAGQETVVKIETCAPDKPISFNVTEAGQSILFKCDQTLKNLDPEIDATNPKMFEGTKSVQILEFLPGATLQEVVAATGSESTERQDAPRQFNFTVPSLPSDEHSLHVYCRKDASKTREEEKNECKVTFHIASSAVRPVMAASAVAGVVASLLHFA
ncbi:SAG-related sequence protein SRS22E [Toxoplasma gondii GAB2-2007-GAL-DOM2]|nr:SAG-related sequence protein SRS22E [Toxoplasma gondii GT1]KFG29740.1 SAG-related sequence protein SRS22E [Toxoplasma gondii GAB2-2007-GAL-DOM2]